MPLSIAIKGHIKENKQKVVQNSRKRCVCNYRWSNTEWWWIPPTYWTFKDVDIIMLCDNTCLLLFFTILLTHSSQCCYNVETSSLIYTVNYCTGFYIIATVGWNILLSIQQRKQWHISFFMLWALLSLPKCQLVLMTFFLALLRL